MWRILVVDDNFFNRKLLVEILKEKAQCDMASNGQEALEAYAHSIKDHCPYDLILLDIAMPEVNGLEVLKSIRDQEATRGVTLGDGLPIIMVTVHKAPVFYAFNRGCDDYIVKPIDGDVLLKKVEEKIQKKS